MTPETGQNIMCARRYIWLQRSRGRMTPETTRLPRPSSAWTPRAGFNGAGAG